MEIDETAAKQVDGNVAGQAATPRIRISENVAHILPHDPSWPLFNYQRILSDPPIATLRRKSDGVNPNRRPTGARLRRLQMV